MTNFVITLAGELLSQAESLIKMGLHPSQIIDGYEKATKAAVDILNEMKGMSISDVRDVKQVSNVLETTLTPKLMGYAAYFSELLAKLCIQALPKNAKFFDPEYIRVCKIMGSNLNESQVLQGMVVGRKAEGSITRVNKPKIAIYACPLDTQ